MIVPLVMTLWFSFQHYNLLNPDQRAASSACRTTRYFLTDPAFFAADPQHADPRRLACSLITVIGGILLALLLDQPMFGPGHRPHPGDLAVLRHADRSPRWSGRTCSCIRTTASSPDIARVLGAAADRLVRATIRCSR